MAKSLRDIVARDVGVLTDTIDGKTATTVGTTAAVIALNNPGRVGLFIQNLSTSVIWIGPFSNPSANKGIRLRANGGAAQLLAKEDYMLVGYEWSAVGQTAGQAIYVQETVIVAELPA